jgi:hypothetical protein
MPVRHRGIQEIGARQRELARERLTRRLDREVLDAAALDEDAPALRDPQIAVVADLPPEPVERPHGGPGGAGALRVELAAVAGA